MAHRTDRIWLIAGIVVPLLLAVASWFIVIHPKRTDTAAVRGAVGDGNLQLVKLRHQLADLDTQQKQLPALLAKLAANQSALPPENTKPTDNSQAAFLNQLQASDLAVNVDVSSLTVGAPIKSALAPSVREVPITMSVDGNVDDVTRFLLRLQSVQARAVLVTSVGLSVDTSANGRLTNTVTASLALTAFQTASPGSTTLTTK